MSEIQEEPADGRNDPDPESSSSSGPQSPPHRNETWRFSQEVIGITSSTRKIRNRVQKLLIPNDNSRGRTRARAMRVIIIKARLEIAQIYLQTDILRRRVEGLDRSNSANRAIKDCGAGSSTDRLRMSATTNFKRELRETAVDIQAMIATPEVEQRLQADYAAGHNTLQEVHEILLRMGTDAEPPEPPSASQRLVHEFIEEEVRRLVDNEDAETNPHGWSKIIAMVKGCWGNTSTS